MLQKSSQEYNKEQSFDLCCSLSILMTCKRTFLTSLLMSRKRTFLTSLLMSRLSTGSFSPDQARLQEDLDELQKWERDSLIQFNPDKCDGIRITNRRYPLTNKYYIHDTDLQTVKDAKYICTSELESVPTNRLSWNKHVDDAAKNATTSLNFLKRNIPGYQKYLFTLLRSILECSLCVCDPHT